jgi:hypothetical protein
MQHVVTHVKNFCRPPTPDEWSSHQRGGVRVAHLRGWLMSTTISGPRNIYNLQRDGLWRQDEVHAAACDRRSRHIGDIGGVEFLGNSHSAHVLYAAQGGRPIAVITGDNDGDKSSSPVPGKRNEADRPTIPGASRSVPGGTLRHEREGRASRE